MTNKTKLSAKALLAGSLMSLVSVSFAFESGSTGIDGAFSPQVDTTLQLPEDGIFNFTSVTIPNSVTVRFEPNTTNTPVVILASGDVTINGSIDVSGTNGADTGAFGDGNIGDDGIPGQGGPGGFNGGLGGSIENAVGGNGLGPGGGIGGSTTRINGSNFGCAGGGAGYASIGSVAQQCDASLGGVAYGDVDLQPLVGGSGGGGGHAGTSLGGGGGGGGGGAILIASSGTINIVGSILANGGSGGDVAGSNSGGVGGAASGGAVRLVATTIAGDGDIEISPGSFVDNENLNGSRSGNGSAGRIKLEAEFLTRTEPTGTFSGPQPLFLANIPGVRITEVAGIASPVSPSGVGDIIIPEATPNPVNVSFATTNIPLGNTIELTVTPQSGSNTVAVSSAISGTDENGIATVSVEIPDGPSTLTAAVTFTVPVTSLQQQDFSQFAKGNKVEKIRVDFDPTKGSMTTFIAFNGEEYTWPSNTLAIN